MNLELRAAGRRQPKLSLIFRLERSCGPQSSTPGNSGASCGTTGSGIRTSGGNRNLRHHSQVDPLPHVETVVAAPFAVLPPGGNSFYVWQWINLGMMTEIAV